LEYFSGGRPYLGYLVFDDTLKGSRPGILVAHNWWGLTEETKSKSDQLAALGYVVFAADIYGKGRRPKSVEEAGSSAGVFKKDRFLLRTHLQDGLAALRKQEIVDKERIAAVGYCFGGLAVLELARSGAALKAVVSFHGGLDDPKPADDLRIKAKMLILEGADDPFSAPADMKALEDGLRAAKIDWQLIKYSGAVHSFTEKSADSDNSKGAAYNEKADRRSWSAMQIFLKEIFN
jgi:dienelactone hydrolase